MGINRKLQILLALTTLLIISLAVGCKGFFVNQPTALTVTPSSPTMSQGGTQQFSAVATNSDNTTSDVTKNAFWSSSVPCSVTIGTSSLANSTPGFATAIGTGASVTITATFSGVQATATPVPPAGLSISPCGLNSNGNFKVGATGQIFTASLNGSPAQGVTWTSNNSNVVSINSSSGAATFPTVGSTFITARDSSANQGQLNITVNTTGQ